LRISRIILAAGYQLLHAVGYLESGYVKKSVQKIHSNYMDKIGIESISEELGVSASYLSRKFKEVTGHSFWICSMSTVYSRQLSY
jgi:AraC-like DNA-binding protein